MMSVASRDPQSIAEAMHPLSADASPCHVALLLTSLRAGGAERVMLDLAMAFVARGLRVDLLLVDSTGPLEDQIPTGARVVDLRAGRALRAMIPLVRYLKAERPDILLSTQSHANLLALAARRASRVQTRVVVRETTARFRVYRDRGVRRLRRRVMIAAIRRYYRTADALVGVSEGVTANFREHVHRLPREVVTIYNPVVTDEMLRRAQEPVEHPWLEAGAPPVILAAGRLVEAKDYPTLLRAFAAVRRERDARLLILGEGVLRPALEQLISDLGLQDSAVLPGYVANPFAWMSRARVFVLSSAWEGLPGALIQALACGCRVVSTDCESGPREILSGGQYGRLVAVGDHAALAAAIIDSLDGPACDEARAAAVERFNARTATDAYLALFSHLTRSR